MIDAYVTLIHIHANRKVCLVIYNYIFLISPCMWNNPINTYRIPFVGSLNMHVKFQTQAMQLLGNTETKCSVLVGSP